MDQRRIPWKAEWKAAGLDPGPLTPEESRLVVGLQKENEEFLARHPYRSPNPVKNVLPFRVWSLPLVAAAALLVVALPLGTPSVSETGTEHLKGNSDAVLSIYRQGQGGSEKLAAGALVRPGDVLQASYRVPRAVQGALLSVDGGQNVTVHLAREGRSVSLVAGEEHPLDFGYELDRAPRYEVFLLVYSSQPFELEPIRQLLKTTPWETLKVDAFGSGIRFTTLPLIKESSR